MDSGTDHSYLVVISLQLVESSPQLQRDLMNHSHRWRLTQIDCNVLETDLHQSPWEHLQSVWARPWFIAGRLPFTAQWLPRCWGCCTVNLWETSQLLQLHGIDLWTKEIQCSYQTNTNLSLSQKGCDSIFAPVQLAVLDCLWPYRTYKISF